jgi:quercetin dioxygenase-like cupin family protein
MGAKSIPQTAHKSQPGRRSPCLQATVGWSTQTVAMNSSFDLHATPAHLGLGARVMPLPGFAWTAEYLERYQQETAADGDDGRLVVISPASTTWTSWERHPAGDELVVQLSGAVTLFQEIDGSLRTVELRGGLAVINPRGVWHTIDVHEPGEALFITPGRGTEHRPR